MRDRNLRDPQRFAMVSGEFNRDMPAICRGAAAQIDCYIEDGAICYAHQLSLRLVNLIVNAAQHIVF
jgi:hypothetical protein